MTKGAAAANTPGPVMVDIEGHDLTDADRRILAHPLTGGVILFTRNFDSPDQLRALVSDIRAARTPSLIVAVDQEGGRVQRFRQGFTRIPPMRNFGKLYDDQPYLALQRAEDCGWVIGCELREMGIDLDFAPVVDLDYGVSEVIGDRAFSADPQAVTVLAGAIMSGLHSAGISSCIKHFPGHGFVTADSHAELPVDGRSLDEFEADLLPFRRLLSRAPSVMTAHLVAQCEDSEPVSFSPRWVNHKLRSELGFGGVVFSDDLSMKGADCEGGILAKVTRAYAAGCDFLPVCNDREAVVELFEQAPDIMGSPKLARLRSVCPPPENFRNTKRFRAFADFLALNEGVSHGA